VIRANRLSKVFGETNENLVYANKDVNLTVNDGELVVILGHSGAGKTTLINMLSTLDTPTTGTIEYDYFDISKLKGKKLTKFRLQNIGFIFQQYHLIPNLTVFENIEVVANLAKTKREDIRELIESVNLCGKEKKFPYQLSGGEQQRVAIARALVKKPKVLFCDEPTGSLDEENGNKILNIINHLNINYGVTVILVSHNPAMGKIASRVVTMNNGMVLSNNIRKAVF
jgi:putative ABC transport system ATP-binding protein